MRRWEYNSFPQFSKCTHCTLGTLGSVQTSQASVFGHLFLANNPPLTTNFSMTALRAIHNHMYTYILAKSDMSIQKVGAMRTCLLSSVSKLLTCKKVLKTSTKIEKWFGKWF